MRVIYEYREKFILASAPQDKILCYVLEFSDLKEELDK